MKKLPTRGSYSINYTSYDTNEAPKQLSLSKGIKALKTVLLILK
jgi:hypothetical protein